MKAQMRLLIARAMSIAVCASAANAGEMPASIYRNENGDHSDADSIHLKQGFLALKKNDMDVASAEFKLCKNIFVANDYAIVAIGRSYERSGEYAVAALALTKLIEFAKTPKSAVAQNTLGQAFKYRADAFLDQHQYAPAYADYMKASTLDPHDAAYDFRMAGSCCTKLKNFDEALKLFDQSRVRGADVPQYHYQKGQCYEELKRYPEAIKEFDACLKGLEIIRKTSPERLTALLRNALTEKKHCHEVLGQKAAAAADQAAFNQLGKDWENDLFGGPTVDTQRK